jgi:hypothetical protein
MYIIQVITRDAVNNTHQIRYLSTKSDLDVVYSTSHAIVFDSLIEAKYYRNQILREYDIINILIHE